MLKFLFRFETYSTPKSDMLYKKPAPTLLSNPFFCGKCFCIYAHRFVCISQKNRAKRKRFSRLFCLTESDTIHTNLRSIVELNKNINGNKHTFRCAYTIVVFHAAQFGINKKTIYEKSLLFE